MEKEGGAVALDTEHGNVKYICVICKTRVLDPRNYKVGFRACRGCIVKCRHEFKHDEAKPCKFCRTPKIKFAKVQRTCRVRKRP